MTPSSSASLLGTCQYRDMASTPSSAATARMVHASRPALVDDPQGGREHGVAIQAWAGLRHPGAYPSSSGHRVVAERGGQTCRESPSAGISTRSATPAAATAAASSARGLEAVVDRLHVDRDHAAAGERPRPSRSTSAASIVIVPPWTKRAPPAFTTTTSGVVRRDGSGDLVAPDRVAGDVERRLAGRAHHEAAHRAEPLDDLLLAPVPAAGAVDRDALPLERAAHRRPPARRRRPPRLMSSTSSGWQNQGTPGGTVVTPAASRWSTCVCVSRTASTPAVASAALIGQIDQRVRPLVRRPANRAARVRRVEHRIDHQPVAGRPRRAASRGGRGSGAPGDAIRAGDGPVRSPSHKAT